MKERKCVRYMCECAQNRQIVWKEMYFYFVRIYISALLQGLFVQGGFKILQYLLCYSKSLILYSFTFILLPPISIDMYEYHRD